MKKILSILILAVVQSVLVASVAQPAKSRLQGNQSNKNTKTNTVRRAKSDNNTKTQTYSRAELMFPTAVDVPEEVDWRRDLYRELDLTKDENAALYYPVQPQGNQINLFTLLFRLFNTGKIPVYEYYSEREDFSNERRMHFKDFLEKYAIYYEIQGNTIKVDNSDIPSSQVLSYYVKESSYYDQKTATYHSRVTALCPVLHESSDFGSSSSYYGREEDEEGETAEPEIASTKKPMFWVRYDDIVPFLSGNTIMTSNINNAATMSMADFFATNKYKGTVYMTNNMQGKLLNEYAKDGNVKKEQEKIEKEMVDFENHIWTTPVDSAELARQDSIAKLQNTKRKNITSNTRRGESSTGNTTVQNSSTKEKKSKSSGSSSPRVSVRRQRH